mgnify:CR=1 FL=1
MTTYFAGSCEVAVIGAGHAGIEAALACARLGHKTILFTINLDAVGNMPCNPAIGGTGKGHLVRELDALGGEMGRAADLVTLQSRLLNMGKGVAVQSKRVQADRKKYQAIMKNTLEKTKNKKGLLVSPIDCKIAAPTLYKIRAGIPKVKILKYKTASPKTSAGVLMRFKRNGVKTKAKADIKVPQMVLRSAEVLMVSRSSSYFSPPNCWAIKTPTPVAMPIRR